MSSSSSVEPDGLPTPEVAARNFVTVVDREAPVAQAVCQKLRTDHRCRFRVYVADDPKLAPNAFQTEDRQGQPIIVFSVSLIAMARNQDELAFILGHEAAHHIEGHIAQSQVLARQGAALAGVFAQSQGADTATVRKWQALGAEVNTRRYSKDFELEADALGTRIAYAAGFNPLRGAEYFNRLPDPGNEFLGTHPPNGARIAIVRRTMADIRAGH